MVEGKWKAAAEVFTTVEGVREHERIKELCSASDVAVYGIICGIAGGFSRNEVKELLDGEVRLSEERSDDLIKSETKITHACTFDSHFLIPTLFSISLRSSQGFREWGEVEGEGMRLVENWLKGEFASVMQGWDNMKMRVLSDVYLSAHHEALTKLLRQRCLVQYTIPYTVCLISMASKAVGMEGREEDVTEILQDMVGKGKVKGKIDEREGIVR